MDYGELQRFFAAHSRATLMLRVAADDYAGARCLLLNGLRPGFVQGAQAIEKFLKSYLLLSDPALNTRGFNHSLPKLLEQTAAVFPQLQLDRFKALTERFRRHYATRYPDNPDQPVSQTTLELLELDGMVVFLNENLPCPRNVRYRTGFYDKITVSLGYRAKVPPVEFWIKDRNLALAPLLPRIEADYRTVMKELYPT